MTATDEIVPPVIEGRIAKRRRATRARMLHAAYEVMAEVGVDDAKIKDITDRADVGFGTFYNYFTTKDDLANQVLDCIINDLGRRNVLATSALRRTDPGLVMSVSMRLVMREAARTPMWQWWALRPDILADRMRDGFGPFARRDIAEALALGIFHLPVEQIDACWVLASWMMVGGIHDMVVGSRPSESDAVVAEAVIRMLGTDPARARALASTKLPAYSPPSIDWNFELGMAR